MQKKRNLYHINAKIRKIQALKRKNIRFFALEYFSVCDIIKT